VVVVGGILYAVCGFDATGTTLNTVEAYDPATDTWTVKASMPTQREGLAVAALKGLLYAVGGGSEALLKVEAYQP
ncbi:MAG TPA: kelch repeat-containing protein, partial [Gemmatimonadales bacterium]|nr:kelch repeat-containing protein [Gemmatimonadales bacterium]